MPPPGRLARGGRTRKQPESVTAILVTVTMTGRAKLEKEGGGARKARGLGRWKASVVSALRRETRRPRRKLLIQVCSQLARPAAASESRARPAASAGDVRAVTRAHHHPSAGVGVGPGSDSEWPEWGPGTPGGGWTWRRAETRDSMRFASAAVGRQRKPTARLGLPRSSLSVRVGADSERTRRGRSLRVGPVPPSFLRH